LERAGDYKLKAVPRGGFSCLEIYPLIFTDLEDIDAFAGVAARARLPCDFSNAWNLQVKTFPMFEKSVRDFFRSVENSGDFL
jgi:hypothetical protein